MSAPAPSGLTLLALAATSAAALASALEGRPAVTWIALVATAVMVALAWVEMRP